MFFSLSVSVTPWFEKESTILIITKENHYGNKH